MTISEIRRDISRRERFASSLRPMEEVARLGFGVDASRDAVKDVNASSIVFDDMLSFL